MKALFVIHCQNPIYGASRSIGNLIRNLDADVDIIFPFKIRHDGITREQILAFYGPRVKNVRFLPQPARFSIVQMHQGPRDTTISLIKDLLYFFLVPYYTFLYRRNRYDFIHLNSAVLYPMLKKRWPMFLHIREALKQQPGLWNIRFPKRLAQAHGVIFINKEVKNSCPPCQAPNVVLVNPYDQRIVASVDAAFARKRFQIQESSCVYALIGSIIPEKGVDFVIRAFLEASLEDAVLLIIGSSPNHDGYEAQVNELAHQDPRIHLAGEVQDIETAYRVTDYVVRGDNVVGAGRTVFESLYSGGGAILMGSREENLSALRLPPSLEDRVVFYPVRNQAALTKAFEQTQGRRFTTRSYFSNVEEYVDEFTTFVLANKDSSLCS